MLNYSFINTNNRQPSDDSVRAALCRLCTRRGLQCTSQALYLFACRMQPPLCYSEENRETDENSKAELLVNLSRVLTANNPYWQSTVVN